MNGADVAMSDGVKKTAKEVRWFTAPAAEVVREVSLLRDQELDRLQLGVICLTRDGLVLAYNETQSRLSQYDSSEAIGRDFFEAVAPCTRNQEFHGRFRSGAPRAVLDETFPFTFRFPTGWRSTRVRLVSDKDTGLTWVLVEPRGRIGSYRTTSPCNSTGSSERKAS